MNSLKVVCFLLILICAYFYKRSCKTRPLILAVGVLSSRHNFEFRQAARSTWLGNYLPHKHNDVKAWFIIGKDDCEIPPSYRLSQYGCEKWTIDPSNLKQMFYVTQEVMSVPSVPGSMKIFSQGFSFKVNHPVIVRRLGVLIKLLEPSNTCKVAIMDIQSQDILIQVAITPNSTIVVDGFLYEDVEAVLLPEGFEGMVLVEGHLKSDVFSNTAFNDGGGVITVNRAYVTPHHLDSLQINNQSYSAVSMQFFVDDVEGLKSTISQEESVTKDWMKKRDHLNDQLIKENAVNNDIVFVDIMDTYRTLPQKLLKFYEWLDHHHDFLYALKTDDDTVVDIPVLQRYLIENSQFKDEYWVWSKFRKDWPVNYIGKWADFDFRSPIYPAFPCGAAYVISRTTLKWLSLNDRSLFPYQGEDVSMGIWLSAIKPIFANDNSFECDSKCKDTSYNRAQLTLEQIYAVWNVYKTCDNLCFC